MATWFRVCPNGDSSIAFSGEGGIYVSGRWNHMGRKAIYCSQSIALCTLEWLSHNGLSISGFKYYKYSIEVPKNLTIKFNHSDLPKDWNLTPATDETRHFAEKYLFSDKILSIAVPSVIIPEEYNLVINPLHKKFQRIANTIKDLGIYTAPNR